MKDAHVCKIPMKTEDSKPFLQACLNTGMNDSRFRLNVNAPQPEDLVTADLIQIASKLAGSILECGFNDLKIFIGMPCGCGCPDQVFTRGHCRRDREDGENTLFEQGLPEAEGTFKISDYNRNRWSFTAPGVELESIEKVFHPPRVLPKSFEVFWFGLEQIKRGAGAGGL